MTWKEWKCTDDAEAGMGGSMLHRTPLHLKPHLVPLALDLSCNSKLILEIVATHSNEFETVLSFNIGGQFEISNYAIVGDRMRRDMVQVQRPAHFIPGNKPFDNQESKLEFRFLVHQKTHKRRTESVAVVWTWCRRRRSGPPRCG